MADITTELPLIKAEAAHQGTDFIVGILWAIRLTENGSAGREFGVLTVSAPTYGEQLRIAANTVVHRLWSYPGNPLTITAHGQPVVSQAWVNWFASIWAPAGVANDPTGLNKNWVKNFSAAYANFIEAERLSAEGLPNQHTDPALPPAPQAAKLASATPTEG